MNIGKNICDLRRSKNVTQEALAAELGVTAAAVSKWENGYTMPDIMMLCALADFFEVTTDELLGRSAKKMYAVIAAGSSELGLAIKKLVEQNNFVAKHICANYPEAMEKAKADTCISHLFASFDKPMSEEEKGETPDGLHSIECHAPTHQQVLDGFKIYLRNMSAYDLITQKDPEKE